MTNNNLNTYLKNISKDGTWGDHIARVALASALKKTIQVITNLGGDCYEIVVENQHGAPLLLGHLSENHYVSLDALLMAIQYTHNCKTF